MRPPHLLLFILMTIAFACKQGTNNMVSFSLKDSIVNKHFEEINSSDYFDTTDINFRVLKAYISNDTIFFKKLSTDIDNDRKFKLQQGALDSCIHYPKLQDLNVDKAYRFIYRAAFCPYTINATVTNKKDSINLHFMLYQYKWDTASCRIISEFDKKLTTKNWDDITESIRGSDFWGLKKENGLHGVDGDNITVVGYEKGDSSYNRPPKFNYVYRWNLGWATLGGPFNLVLKLSGNKQGCIWVE